MKQMLASYSIQGLNYPLRVTVGENAGESIRLEVIAGSLE